jgi:Fe-S cluster biogenesis protein NfuA
MNDQDWRSAGERIEVLLAAAGTGGAVARERAEELVRLVADLYGAGLQRILEVLHEAGALGDDALDRLAADDLVASLLLVHGLHPYDAGTRIEQALAAHRGEVELIDVTPDGVVRLRMTGTGEGCTSSASALRPAVEAAIEAAAPEVTAVEIEERTSVIPISALFSRLQASA